MGSIESYRLQSGERRYRARYRDPENRQREKGGFARKNDAANYLATISVSSARGEYVNPRDGREALADLGERWLKNQQVRLKPSTFHSVDSAWRNHVRPRFGPVPIAKIRPSAVESWIAELSRTLSPSSVIRAHGVLSAVLQLAVRDNRLAQNPAVGLALPRKVRTSRKYLTHEQVAMLADFSGINRTLVNTLAYTGLRWGEETGLRVKDLDGLRRRLHIRVNAVWVGGVLEVGLPKNHQERSVPYPRFLDQSLLELTAGKGPESLLFGNGDHHLRPPDSRRGWWISAIRQAQAVDETFPSLTRHDLRHTAASLAVSAGANVKVLQRMLGHASASMTLDTYADLFDEDLDGVAERLDSERTRKIVGF